MLPDIKKNRKIVATIEARMTSNRLPGKVLMSACGKTMLEHLVERLRRIAWLDEIVVATTINKTDDPIIEVCQKINCCYFRGSENDVLKRVLDAAKSVDADIICEITADCPLLDPDIASQVIHAYLANDFDYVSNCQVRFTDDTCYHTYPIGMDTQVFSVNCLAIADQETKDPLDREHVSVYITRNHKFKLCLIPASPDLTWDGGLGLTLDEKSDYEMIKKIFEELYPKNPHFTLRDILSFLREHPEVVHINRHVQRKSYNFEKIKA